MLPFFRFEPWRQFKNAASASVQPVEPSRSIRFLKHGKKTSSGVRRCYHVKMRQAIESCLLGEVFWSSSWEQRQLQPPSKLAITWARDKSIAAPNPSMKALWLGSLHSNIHNLKCLTCLCKKISKHLNILSFWKKKT